MGFGIALAPVVQQRLEGLHEAARPGRPAFPTEVALYAVKIACERPDTCGRSLCLWDCQEIARHLQQREVVPTISAQTVQRMLASHQLKPWRNQRWLSPKVPWDAVFAAKVRRISELWALTINEFVGEIDSSGQE